MLAMQCPSSAVRQDLSFRLRFVVVLVVVALLPRPAVTVAAGPAADTPPKAQKPKDADKAKDKEELPSPEDLVVQTHDGLNLVLTYYRNPKGKQAVPVVLLHMWKQNRNDYKDLAPALQAQGCAVIVPDLRGHGESVHFNGSRKGENLKAPSLPPGQFAAMVTRDMEAVKKFLWERNNDGELNIDKLCVVGAEMGASVAVNFAVADARDQDNNPVPRPEYKLGRFVKALVLISPELSFRGLPIRAANAQTIRNVALLILVGKDGKGIEDAKRINGMFERFHPEPEGDNKTDKRTLFFGKLPTSLQGTKLLDPKFKVAAIIADFIYRRLIKSEESREWTWRERKLPHG
jgi:pimeloyl-ACP methyl ester carboxylesterase